MKIFTCALRPFETNDSFFARDSGLLCRSLQTIGVESKVVLPALGHKDEFPCLDAIRPSATEIRSVDWWKSLEIDGVAIITWGHAEDTPIILAAKSAGIIIILVTDDGEGKRTDPKVLFKDTWRRLYHKSRLTKCVEAFLKFPPLYAWLFWKKSGRLEQYRHGDLVTCWTKRIADNVKDGLKAKYPKSEQKFLLGYPSSTSVIPRYDTGQIIKLPQIVAVARWDAIKHKRPQFLIHSCEAILRKHPTVQIHIFGKLIPFMTEAVDAFPDHYRERITLHGFCKNPIILQCMAESQVAVCPSASDCGPVPMAEALCHGCTIVGGGNVAHWAAELGYGTPVISDTSSSFADAVIEELSKWKRGTYDPDEISTIWKEHYSAIRFVEEIRDFVSATKQN